jgi:hypothetical protein
MKHAHPEAPPRPQLLIRDDDPLKYEQAAVRWLARYAAQDRAMRLVEARRASSSTYSMGLAGMTTSRCCGSSGCSEPAGYQEAVDRVA